jgi:hypothetical protein
MTRGPEYVFVSAARFVGVHNAAFSPSVIAGARTLAPTFALNALGYDARAYSLFSASPALAQLSTAKALVFADLGAAEPAAYRSILASASGRVFYDLVEAPAERTPSFDFCLEAGRAGAALTAASEHVARSVSSLAGLPVEPMPEPLQGLRHAPHVPRARPRSRALEWLAERAGLATESWRLRLFWSGEESEVASIVETYPALARLGGEIPLALQCIAPQGAALESLAERLREDDPDALRLRLEAWSPDAMAQALANCDVVLLPGGGAAAPSRLIAALHAGRLGIARPSPYYGKLAEFAWTGADPAEGIRWALSHPDAVLDRLTRGQQYLDQVHAPTSVARAWMALFLKRSR